MSEFIRILDRFQDHENNLKHLGNEVVKRYPQSATLVELTDELHAALEGLGALRQKLGQAIDQAEQEMALKSTFLMQMADSPYYSRLSDSEKDKLAENLLAHDEGLASDQDLLDFSRSTLTQRSEEELLAEISKTELMEIGRITAPGADDFAAYDAGLKMVRENLLDPEKHDEIVEEIAKAKLGSDPGALIRLMYQEAFGRQHGAEMPVPQQGPDGEMPEGGEEAPALAPGVPAEPIEPLNEQAEDALKNSPPVEEEKSEEEVTHPESEDDALSDEPEEEESE